MNVAVPAVMVFWMFVASVTDDGYFAVQDRNATISGDVGNYYQLYDQSFIPFTWLYQGLGWWQQLVGDAPVLQRIPALVTYARLTADRGPTSFFPAYRACASRGVSREPTVRSGRTNAPCTTAPGQQPSLDPSCRRRT